MRTFIVIGHRIVAGRGHGESLSEEDLAGCNIDALIQGAHLKENPTKADKVETKVEE